MEFIITIPDVDAEHEWAHADWDQAAQDIASWISYSSSHIVAISVKPVEERLPGGKE